VAARPKQQRRHKQFDAISRAGGGLNRRPSADQSLSIDIALKVERGISPADGDRYGATVGAGGPFSSPMHYEDMHGGQHIERFDSAGWCRAKAATLRVQAERGANATSRARAFEIAADWEAKADEFDRPASVTAGHSVRAHLGERTLLQLRYVAARCRMVYLANYRR
jgi:hypothetical protein